MSRKCLLRNHELVLSVYELVRLGLFFFSSRRRHTRSLCDWSSDVCSSDLERTHELETRSHELAQSVGELRALGEVTQAVNSTLDLATVLSTIVAKAVELSGTEAGSIYVVDPTTQVDRKSVV